MDAVLLTGYGGFEKLAYRSNVPTPVPGPEEVLIKVAAAGINNTDINTRTGWYSKAVTQGTGAGGAEGFAGADPDDGGWQGASIAFPRIQGADCCGRIVAVGSGVDEARLGQRVIVRSMQRTPAGHRAYECWTLGSECDGAFAQYMKAPSAEAFAIQSGWSDAELASIPCAYSTAENMLCRAEVAKGQRVVITGASGGVGSAAVQLAKRRGARVTAIAGKSKARQVMALGAEQVVERGQSIALAMGPESVDAVIDLVAGPQWPQFLQILKKGGCYACAGAIAGPIVELDVRTLYLKDLTLLGCTFQDDAVFANLVSYVEKGEIKPLVAATYPLKDIVRAQKDFLAKKFVGKLVLIPGNR